MILGILDRDPRGHLEQEVITARRLLGGESSDRPIVWSNQYIAFCWVPFQAEPPQSFADPNGRIVVTFDGKIYNAVNIAKRLGLDPKSSCSGEILAHLYHKYGENFLQYVNGKFAFALWDKTSHKLILARDRLGIQPLFYFDDGKRFIFSSSLRALSATGWVDKQLNRQAILQYLLYCYNPGNETFLRDVYKLPAGHLLSLNGSKPALKPYWRLSFAATRVKTEERYREEILELMEDAIRIRLEPDRPPGIFLSGGTDSSAIVSLASKIGKEPVHTYSFRCEGQSYDESPYARFVARRYGTRHTEIPYSSDRVSVISEAVRAMDEPFCDIGIEIGTYLLGQAAQDKVSYVFSGEGGDELFGGHPVYVADKMAAIVDRFPRALITPLLRLLQKLPDTDQKKDIRVKLKRFAYSLSFPPGLLSHRWRIYYTPGELRELCTADFFGASDVARLFAAVLNLTEAADGPDQLSRSLQVDYRTLVDFYLRRLELLRAFSLESHLPLLDHRLVEYAAEIPSYLKIRHLSDTKYIYKKVLEALLPREILYDRPKLGHGVPLKNWLRDDTKIRGWVTELLSEGPINDSGFFSSGFIRQLLQEHTQRIHNHSHRLWALVVLGLWLQTHFRN